MRDSLCSGVSVRAVVVIVWARAAAQKEGTGGLK